MAGSKRGHKNPKAAFTPPSKEPRIRLDPESNRQLTPVWQFGYMDLGGRWSFSQLSAEEWWQQVHPKLRNFETMTWQEIVSASGGRSKGSNNHEVGVEETTPAAQERLTRDLKLLEVDVLFSLRLDGKTRIWGILDSRVLKLLWYDPHHEVCPVAAK